MKKEQSVKIKGIKNLGKVEMNNAVGAACHDHLGDLIIYCTGDYTISLPQARTYPLHTQL